jgi:hypothetical protein
VNKIYVVSYDFKDPSPAQLEAFYTELKSFTGWWHFIEGTWLIKTDLDAKGVFARLRPHLTSPNPPDVNVLVVDTGADFAGWLPTKAWDWIKRNRLTPDFTTKEASSG